HLWIGKAQGSSTPRSCAVRLLRAASLFGSPALLLPADAPHARVRPQHLLDPAAEPLEPLPQLSPAAAEGEQFPQFGRPVPGPADDQGPPRRLLREQHPHPTTLIVAAGVPAVVPLLRPR